MSPTPIKKQAFIEPCIADEPFHGQKTGKPGWNSRVCGGTTIIGCIGINRNLPATAILIVCLSGMIGTTARLAADQSEEAYERGQAALRQGKLDEALAAYDAACKLRPREAKFVGMRAVVLLKKGDYPRGIAGLKEAIRLHPGDVGPKYRPRSDKPLAPEAIKHGREQVRRMIRDRPPMAQYPKEAGFLRTFAARKFAGESLGTLIDWDPAPPLHSDAEHVAPTAHEHGNIVLELYGPRRRQRSFEELWAGAIYELHNINYSKHYVDFHRRAAAGNVTRRQFVAGIVKYEVLAAQETRAFYAELYLPFVEKNKLSTDPSLWFAEWWEQPDEALHGLTDESQYPWNPYGRQYDWISVKRLFRLKEYRKTVTLLERMCLESEDFFDHGDHALVHLWLGRCRLRLDEPKKAVEEFSASLQLDPHDPETYRARATAQRKLGEKEKADADLKRAEALEKEE
ncbi:MAG: tetratricopeptide repeat protein [Pirellulales bacterium]|nr:tetratricopeptide repeat protein [Pirellulales bacterium]